VARKEAGDMGFIGRGVISGEQDGAAGKTGFHSVERRLGLTFGRGGAGGELSVLLVCSDLGGG